MAYPLDAAALIMPRAIFFGGLAIVTGVGACLAASRRDEGNLAAATVAAYQLLLGHIRRKAYLRRRRQTAKRLNALRCDREFLLGRLQPSVTAQVLSLLDRGSLSSLRLANRQSYLLVGCAATRLKLNARGLRQAAAMPLEVVWPQLRVVSLQLGPLAEETELLSQPTSTAQPTDNYDIDALQIGLAPISIKQNGTASTGKTSNPWADSRAADGVLREMLTQCGLDGLTNLELLDLSGCTAGFSAETLECLAQVSKHQKGKQEVAVLAPLRALLGEDATVYTSPHTAVRDRFLNTLKRLSRHGLKLCLMGGNCIVTYQQQLQQLCKAAGNVISCISITDAHPYSNSSLDWRQGFSHLSHLTQLTVTPATQLSLNKLFPALASLPMLQRLSIGSSYSKNGLPDMIVKPSDLQHLTPLTALTVLELPTLRLQNVKSRDSSTATTNQQQQPGNQQQHESSATVQQTTELPLLPHIRSFSVLWLECSDGWKLQQMADMLPSIEHLALGMHPWSSAFSKAGLTDGELDAVLSMETATASSAITAAKKAHEAAEQRHQQQQLQQLQQLQQQQAAAPHLYGNQHNQVWGQGNANQDAETARNVASPERLQWLNLLQNLRNVKQLQLSSGCATAVAAQLKQLGYGTSHKTVTTDVVNPWFKLPCLQDLHIHHVSSYEELCLLLGLSVGVQSIKHVGLHHVGNLTGRPTAGLQQASQEQQADVMQLGSSDVLHFLHVACSNAGLEGITLQGGDFGLAHGLCIAPPPVKKLTIKDVPMMIDDDVRDLVQNWTAACADYTVSTAEKLSCTQSTLLPEERSRHQYRMIAINERQLRLLCCKQLNGALLETALSRPGLDIQTTDFSVADTYLAMHSFCSVSQSRTNIDM